MRLLGLAQFKLYIYVQQYHVFVQPGKHSSVVSCQWRPLSVRATSESFRLSGADIALGLCLQQSVAQVGTILPPLSPTYQPMYVEGSMQLSQVGADLNCTNIPWSFFAPGGVLGRSGALPRWMHGGLVSQRCIG